MAIIFFGSSAFGITNTRGELFHRTLPSIATIASTERRSFTHLPSPQTLIESVLRSILFLQPWLGPLEDYSIQFINSIKLDHMILGQETHYHFEQTLLGYPIKGSTIDITLKAVKERYDWIITHHTLIPPSEFPPIKALAVTSFDEALSFIRITTSLKLPVYHRTIEWQKLNGKWKLLYSFRFRGHPTQYLVDAHTSELYEENIALAIAEPFQGTVLANSLGQKSASRDAVHTFPLANATVESSSSKIITDRNGHFVLPNADNISNINVLAHLKGPRVTVLNQNEPATPVKAELSTEKDNVIRFTNDNGSEERSAEFNLFFHINELNQWLLDRSVTNENVLKPVEVKANLTYDPCVALYIQGVLLFHKSGSRRDKHCTNMATDTVIRHEYGHFVDEAFGGITDLALSEGWGDILAGFSLEVDTIAEDVFGKGTYLRKLDNTEQFDIERSQNPKFRHQVGQSFAGFAWNLRSALVRTEGPVRGSQIAEALVLSALVSNSRDIPRAVIDIYVRDDNDGNLANGTPHGIAIRSAAAAHGLESYIDQIH